MSQPDPLLPVLRDDELSERAAAVFADIRATRNTDFVNNIWRVLANDPQLLEQTWAEVKGVLGADGELDVLTKQLIYIAVSVAQGVTWDLRMRSSPNSMQSLGWRPRRTGWFKGCKSPLMMLSYKI